MRAKVKPVKILYNTLLTPFSNQILSQLKQYTHGHRHTKLKELELFIHSIICLIYNKFLKKNLPTSSDEILQHKLQSQEPSEI